MIRRLLQNTLHDNDLFSIWPLFATIIFIQWIVNCGGRRRVSNGSSCNKHCMENVRNAQHVKSKKCLILSYPITFRWPTWGGYINYYSTLPQESVAVGNAGMFDQKSVVMGKAGIINTTVRQSHYCLKKDSICLTIIWGWCHIVIKLVDNMLLQSLLYGLYISHFQ